MQLEPDRFKRLEKKPPFLSDRSMVKEKKKKSEETS